MRRWRMSHPLEISYKNPTEARAMICPYRTNTPCESTRCMKWRWEVTVIVPENPSKTIIEVPKYKRTERGYCGA